jgi:hypothetical protein
MQYSIPPLSYRFKDPEPVVYITMVGLQTNYFRSLCYSITPILGFFGEHGISILNWVKSYIGDLLTMRRFGIYEIEHLTQKTLN